ncbi:MAG: shikimate kinase [Prevotella sp.]|nr:shikimate kinase [Prevotella sp.]MBP3789399.1 shikimate kinase [Prevotella sp.]
MTDKTQHSPNSETNQTPLPWGGAGGGFSRIILIGYMGAGKTTIGKALSKELGLQFYDLDWYIESRRRKTVPQLFAELGEEGFRKIEYNMLHEVAEFENVIISCGGGTPCFFDNMDYMNRQGKVIYLRCEPEVLQKHLMMGKTERPLLKGKTPEELTAYISDHLQEREPFYNKAQYTLDVSLMDNYEKIAITVDKLREMIEA